MHVLPKHSEYLRMCGSTVSNKNSATEVGQKSCTAAEESGMPSPVPIQPHSFKVCHWNFHLLKIINFIYLCDIHIFYTHCLLMLFALDEHLLNRDHSFSWKILTNYAIH